MKRLEDDPKHEPFFARKPDDAAGFGIEAPECLIAAPDCDLGYRTLEQTRAKPGNLCAAAMLV
ncbi:MAG: hypothetical protein L3J37_11450 [Rhodobacteraceae bacterium]|nr:hypothetical protein [Paracoccaceae bacterium]